ncbi:GM22547 [Drosophila sechellia]|uniref:GM22547 n=1 Tax=Drosophila sechellia TaxID=7238 RepID=B4IK85_DROSE|nr:GM22547 [Drosophila sechellia]
MSYIQFESGREKDKARQELREARQVMLQQAKERAELRGQRERQKELRGEADWMLPAVAKKLEKPAKKSKKKVSKHKSRSKSKSSKKKSRKHRSSSSSSESSTSSSSSSSKDEKERKRRKKKSKKSRKESASEDEWVEAAPPPAADNVTKKEPPQRDDWMTSEALLLKTFSRERKEPAKPNEKAQQIDAYDPAKSVRELNPYWKSNGTGLPGFQKPQDDDERQDKAGIPSHLRTGILARDKSPSSYEEKKKQERGQQTKSTPSCLTDEQNNKLAGKVIKAELKGKKEPAAELNKQLGAARKERAEFIASGQSLQKANTRPAKSKASAEHVLLTKVDQSGNVRPLVQSGDPNEPYGGRRGQKRGSKKVDTHVDGQRVRYFADDDRYDIKQMFEREKHATAAEANLQYADIVSKHKNPNDDLEDIFADKVRKQISAGDAEKREMQSAIREHEKLVATLDNCERCFDSAKLDKQLLVSLGDKIYLSLPWYMGLQSGHCILTTLQHAPCCTQLDEDAWEEMSNFRKALTRMFAARRQDVIFYEIANKLHRRPHLSVHCIPIPASQGEMAPFYFKKAIESRSRSGA